MVKINLDAHSNAKRMQQIQSRAYYRPLLGSKSDSWVLKIYFQQKRLKNTSS